MTAAEISDLLFPHISKQTDSYRKSGYPFAYYTNADTALKIIKSQSIWMRKPSLMNDYSEIEHGFECLNAALNSEIGTEFREVVDMLHTGLSTQIDGLYANVMSSIRSTTFIACFTKHSPLEDDYGRLSMWRAYGKNNGVAFVFKPKIFFSRLDADIFGVLSSPVIYSSYSEIAENLKVVTANIKANIDTLKAELPIELLQELILLIYITTLVYNKHIGFKEEEEWRALTYAGLAETPRLLSKSVQVVNGTPQMIQSLNFKDDAKKEIAGFNFNDLLKRIIIGPCEHPEATKEALVHQLEEHGFLNANDIIHISNIPLRSN